MFKASPGSSNKKYLQKLDQPKQEENRKFRAQFLHNSYIVAKVRVVTFSFLCPLSEKYGTFIARCNALIEKVSPCKECDGQLQPRTETAQERWAGDGHEAPGGVLLLQPHAKRLPALVLVCAQGEGCYFFVCVPTIREIRDFNREEYGTNRERVCINSGGVSSVTGASVRSLMTALSWR
eukprot:SAG31_NODE_159_length_21911_cov_12.220750_2_plen_179_part_00